VDIFDDRKALDKGFEIIYEARDLDIPQAQRDGLTAARTNPAATKKAIQESADRIKAKVATDIKKAYWTEAKEELRRQVGTLRFNINALAEQKPKAEKKAVLALKKDFFAAVEATDFAIRSKDGAKAEAEFAKATAALDAVLAAL